MRLWIDTDFGFDDLAAIALCHEGGARIEGLSLVAGNAPLPQVVTNAHDAAAAFGWAFPLYLGAEAPLHGSLEHAGYVLSARGWQTVGRDLPPAAAPQPLAGDAVTGLVAYLKGGGRDVLALGPLTNLALLLQARPDLGPALRVTWMGGAFARGNHTAVAEFNAAVDPEAVAVVLAAGVDLLMVGLECCRDVSVGLQALDPLRARQGEGAALIGDLYEGYIRIAADGTRPMAIYDPVAAALALNRDWAETLPVHMQIETEGRHTRGMTVIEWRSHKASPNVRVAVNPRAFDILNALDRALLRLARDYDASR